MLPKKTDEQKEVINNLDKFNHSREEVINLLRDYTRMMFDSSEQAKQDETKGTGLKILAPKQMLPILPKALARVKADNNSECLENEIKQIAYFLYQKIQMCTNME